MHSDRYVHPEFGFLSPTPQLRRELRMAFFSVLFGIGIGAAAVIALNGSNNLDEPRASHEMSSAPQAPSVSRNARGVRGHSLA
jgi:hypothetical protein